MNASVLVMAALCSELKEAWQHREAWGMRINREPSQRTQASNGLERASAPLLVAATNEEASLAKNKAFVHVVYVQTFNPRLRIVSILMWHM